MDEHLFAAYTWQSTIRARRNSPLPRSSGLGGKSPSQSAGLGEIGTLDAGKEHLHQLERLSPAQSPAHRGFPPRRPVQPKSGRLNQCCGISREARQSLPEPGHSTGWDGTAWPIPRPSREVLQAEVDVIRIFRLGPIRHRKCLHHDESLDPDDPQLHRVRAAVRHFARQADFLEDLKREVGSTKFAEQNLLQASRYPAWGIVHILAGYQVELDGLLEPP